MAGSVPGRQAQASPDGAGAAEAQRCGPLAFLRACVWAGWVEYRALRYYPSNLALAAVQQLTLVGVWYFTARFFGSAANHAVSAYGGNYVSYVLLGIIFNQVGLAALDGPGTTISDAFWDKRLETYHLAAHGIWANVAGRMGFNVLFATVMQACVLALLLATGAIHLRHGVHLGIVALTWILSVAANGGLGLVGASLFFLLEVKTGQDPVTWAYRYVVMIVSGLYIPLGVLPGWLKALGGVLPQTYTFELARATLLTGAGYADPRVSHALLGLGAAALVTCLCGYALLTHAIRRAQRQGGVGVVV